MKTPEWAEVAAALKAAPALLEGHISDASSASRGSRVRVNFPKEFESGEERPAATAARRSNNHTVQPWLKMTSFLFY